MVGPSSIYETRCLGSGKLSWLDADWDPVGRLRWRFRCLECGYTTQNGDSNRHIEIHDYVPIGREPLPIRLRQWLTYRIWAIFGDGQPRRLKRS